MSMSFGNIVPLYIYNMMLLNRYVERTGVQLFKCCNLLNPIEFYCIFVEFIFTPFILIHFSAIPFCRSDFLIAPQIMPVET